MTFYQRNEIKLLNNALQYHTATAQGSGSWLISRHSDGQVIAWISSTKLKTFEVCLLRTDHANNFQTFRGLDAYQDAIDLVIQGGE